MNAAQLWLGLDKLGYQTVWALLSLLWQSSILLLAAAGLACILRRRAAALRHAVWVAAILISPLAPLLGWAASRSGTPQARIPVVPAYSAPVFPAPSDFAAEPALAAPPEAAPQAFHVQEDSEPGLTVAAAAPAPTVLQAERPAQPATPRGQRSPLAFGWAWALLIYAAGAAGFLGLVVLGKLRLSLWARRGQPVTDARLLWLFHAAGERLGLRRNVAVVHSPRAHGVLTIGTLRPVVVLPQGLEADMSDQELTAIALHELAHVRRRDPALLGLLSVVRAVLFFHPLVWLACRQASMLAEAACDEVVLGVTGQAVGYAKMLTRLAEQPPARALGTELAAGFILSRKSFVRRIEAILSSRPEGIRRLSRPAMTATLLVAVGALGLALALPLGQKAQAQVARRRAAATQPAEGAATQPADATAKSVARVLPLRYASAPELAKVLKSHSPGLNIASDERSNSLVLSGSEQDLEAATLLVAPLDQATAAAEGRGGNDGPATGRIDAPAGAGRSGQPTAAARRGEPRPEPLPARFQAVVYQVSMPSSRIAVDLDAQALSAKAKSQADFQKQLEGIGQAKILYAVDQVLDMSANTRINIGANEPVVTGTSGSASRPSVSVSYQSLGGIFIIGGSRGGEKKLQIHLSVELSALTESAVQLANDVRAVITRHATIQYNGPVEEAKPFVAISVDAAGEQKGMATAFICRAVVTEAK